MSDTATAFLPRCVLRRGKPCKDCVECLSAIPENQTCASCRNATACKAMWGLDDPEAQHYCSWIPSRYSPSARPPAKADPRDEAGR